MKEQLTRYVDLLFAGAPDAEDIRQEILQNTLDRYDDLISQGKSHEAAYSLAISGIGDISELLGRTEDAPPCAPAPAPKRAEKNRKYTAIAVMLYILCVVPVIVFGQLGSGVLGLCLMFIMIAAATALLILQGQECRSEHKHSSADPASPRAKLDKSVHTLIFLLGVIIYLAISFYTGSWHITWLVFPIIAAIRGLVGACMDLKEATKYEA